MATSIPATVFAAQSGDPIIDSLVYAGLPLWTEESPSSGLTVTYAFMTTPLAPSGMEDLTRDFAPLNITQQSAVRLVYATAEPLTGLTFLETADTLHADISFGTADIEDPFTMAVTVTDYAIRTDATGASTLDRQDYVYFDNAEFGGVMADPLPGTLGYETVLHEIGHTLGLDDTAYTRTLPALLDNTDFTVMSYNETDTYKSTFAPLDIQTLQYLYADSGTIRPFGLVAVPAWPGVDATPPAGGILAVA